MQTNLPLKVCVHTYQACGHTCTPTAPLCKTTHTYTDWVPPYNSNNRLSSVPYLHVRRPCSLNLLLTDFYKQRSKYWMDICGLFFPLKKTKHTPGSFYFWLLSTCNPKLLCLLFPQMTVSKMDPDSTGTHKVKQQLQRLFRSNSLRSTIKGGRADCYYYSWVCVLMS